MSAIARSGSVLRAIGRPFVVVDGLGCAFAVVVEVGHEGKDIFEVRDAGWWELDGIAVAVVRRPVAAVLIDGLRELCPGSVVITAAAGIDEVDRFGEVELLQQVTAEAADVGSFDGESAGELALNGDVEGFGIGRLDFAVETPGDGEIISEAPGRGSARSLAGCSVIDGRKGMPVSEARRCGTLAGALDGVSAGRIGHRGVQAEGTVLVEGVDQGLRRSDRSRCPRRRGSRSWYRASRQRPAEARNCFSTSARSRACRNEARRAGNTDRARRSGPCSAADSRCRYQ